MKLSHHPLLGGIAISNQMAMTGVNQFISCDVTDREGKIRTNEFRLFALCLVAIAISNPMVIIHSLFGQGNPQRLTIYGHGIPPDHWLGNTASVWGQGILFNYIQQISDLI